MVMVLLIFLFLGLVLATYRDLQIREVPDTVSKGLTLIGIIGYALLDVQSSTPLELVTIILFSITTSIFIVKHGNEKWIPLNNPTLKEAFPHVALLILFFAGAYCTNYVGALQTSAGFLGAGAGFTLGLIMYYLRQWGGGDAKLMMAVGAILGLSTTDFAIFEFAALLIVAGAVYGFGYTGYLALRHAKVFIKGFKALVRSKRVHRVRLGLVGTGVAVVLLLFFVTPNTRIVLGLFLVAVYLLAYTWIAIHVIEQKILLKSLPIKDLTEGDWLAEDVKKGSKIIVSKKNTGLTKEQLATLKREKIKSVLVREGIPFVPSFLLAFLAYALLFLR